MSFLFVDRIFELVSGEYIRGIKHITKDDYYLSHDTNGRPCFIPSLIGETLGQLAAWNVMYQNNFTARPVAGVVSSATLHRSAYVGETMLLESYIDCIDDRAVQYHSEARIGNERIFSVDGALGPLLPMTDFIGTKTVMRQFAEIYRPGDWASIVGHTSRSRPEYGTELLQEIFDHTQNDMLSFDSIVSCDPGIQLVAEKYITKSAPYFPDHFPYKPVLPMTVLLECKINIAKEFVARAPFDKTYEVSELRKIKMNDFVLPGDIIVCHVTVKHHTASELILTCRSEVDGRRVCVVDIVLIAL